MKPSQDKQTSNLLRQFAAIYEQTKQWPRIQWPEMSLLDLAAMFISIVSVLIVWIPFLFAEYFPAPVRDDLWKFMMIAFIPSVMGHITGFLFGLIRICSIYGKLSILMTTASPVIFWILITNSGPFT